MFVLLHYLRPCLGIRSIVDFCCVGVVRDMFDLCLLCLFVCACLMACSPAVGIVIVVVDFVVMIVVIVLVGGIVDPFSLLALWLSVVSSCFFEVLFLCC